MNLRQAAWQHQNEDVDATGALYPQANVMREPANRSHRNVNYTTIFCVITFVLYALCWLF